MLRRRPTERRCRLFVRMQRVRPHSRCLFLQKRCRFRRVLSEDSKFLSSARVDSRREFAIALAAEMAAGFAATPAVAAGLVRPRALALLAVGHYGLRSR